MSESTKTSIGSYTVTGQLPGPGEDYYATSPEGTRVLVRQFEAGEALAQVRQEVTVCATLEHPAIARTIDSFEAGGKLALVFEHFEAIRLSQIMKRPGARQLLSDAAIWLIAYEVTGALGQAHSASDPAGDLVTVCHGHLSADCILVSPSGQLRLEGLGLAALVGGGQLPAAPGFQAPEQADGGRVTPRGDLYSAAVLLWSMLSGREPKSGIFAPSLSTIIDRVPSELRESLERALQPSVGKRKITAMELEQALGEVVDEAAGRQALSAATGSTAPSGSAQADTGPAMLGLMGRPTVGSEPDVAELAAEPKAAARPAVGQSPAATKAKAIGARARKSSVRSRQKTLLGAFGAPKPAAPAGVPRQAVARKAAESAGAADGSGADQGAPAAKPAAASPEPPPSSRRPPPPSSRRPPPSSRRGAAKPLPPRARESAPGRADGLELPPRRSKPPKMPSAAGAQAEPAAPESAEPPTVERVLEVDGGGGDVQAEQAIEEMILGATVGAEAGSPTDRPPVLAPGIDDLLAEPLATGKVSNAPPGAATAAAAAPGLPAGEPDPMVGASPGPGPSEPSAAESGSPWHASAAPSVVQPGPAEQPLSIGKMVLIALGTAVVVIVLGVWWTRRQVVLSTDVPIPEAPSAAATAPPTAATSAPSAQPTTSAAATAGEDAGPDPSTLPKDKGLLQILFDGPPGAEVFRFGKSIGKVGEPLEIPCGRAFVRVGTPPGPSWLSAGVSVDVKCQALTEAKVEPL